MKKTRMLAVWPGGFILAGCLVLNGASAAPTKQDAQQILTSDLDQQVRTFLQKEVTAHVADIKTLDPPPDRVVGALTTGEFSWGTFMRTLGVYSEFANTKTIAGHDVPQMIGKIAEIERSRGGKSWAQLYAAEALESFGTDLKHNELWQALTPEEKDAYFALLDVSRFYDAKTHKLDHLPENYFGVAARIEAIDYELGLLKDRASLDDLLNQAAAQFTSGALFADDSRPTGRYDRYSNEYARALYVAAEVAGRTDLMRAIAPSLREQMKLWWDLLSPDGYGYSWGRSLGAISYIDTMEIAAFLGKYPEFRPTPLSQLASAYFAAWSWLRNDLNVETHLLSVFAFGRGDYGYITKEREWQQTTTFLAKVMGAHESFMRTLNEEGVRSFSSQPSFADVARFVYFRNEPGRKFGVWIVRQGNIHFALPFVTGPKAATSDYEPAPHGFPGLAVPVEKICPWLVPFLELEAGRTISPADGADEIRPGADGKSVTAIWKHWVVPGSKAGETVDPGLVSEVTWSLQGNNLHKVETLTAATSLKVNRLWMAIPSRNNHLETLEVAGVRVERLTSNGMTLDVQASRSNGLLQISAYATGDDPLGRSDRRPIPLHLILESKNITLAPGAPQSWEITLTVH